MLREQFIASVGVPAKPPDTSASKDAAIFVHEFQPLSAQRAVLKKSATPQKCLAVSEDHVFAAQANKAVVHVYSREKGNQEATVPFVDRISSISLACDDSVLVLGSATGNIFFWETCTGRQITTQHTHLQAVTALAVDPTSNYLLSGSKDSNIEVWSIPDQLSFTNLSSYSVGPLRGFNLHGSEVTALEVGHSASLANFAISAAKDGTCFVWDYSRATVLRQFHLSGIPTCIALDPADRAAYIGCEDGDVQMLDLLGMSTGSPEAVQNGNAGTAPVRAPSGSKWKLPEKSHGSVLSIAVSFDGTMVLSGHESGSILSWDVARKSFSANQTTHPLPGPVTNLSFLPVSGFRRRNPKISRIRIPEIVKAKFDGFKNSKRELVPRNYVLNVQFTDRLPSSDGEKEMPSFDQVLAASVFPPDLLDEGLNELASWGRNPDEQTTEVEETAADFMALDDTPLTTGKPSLEEENANLKLQLEALRRVQMTSFDKIERLGQERDELLRREQKRANANGKLVNDDSDDPME